MRRSTSVFGLAALLAIAGCRSEVPACAPAPSTGAPDTATSEPKGPPASVEVARDGTVSLEGARLADATELTSRMRMSLQTRPELHVVVSADKDASYERVVRVADLVKAGGVKHLSFALTKAPAPAARTSTPTGPSGGEAAPTAIPTPSVFPSEPWKCQAPPHAPHAEHEPHEQVEVFVRIHVDASGNPTNVDVIDDPGRGFGDAARACAMQRHYRAAVDAKGNAVPGVLKLHIRFGQ